MPRIFVYQNSTNDVHDKNTEKPKEKRKQMQANTVYKTSLRHVMLFPLMFFCCSTGTSCLKPH